MSAARDRLKNGYYNNRELAAGTNPGGMARNGHRVNFTLALKDVGDVAQELSDSNDATVAAVVADNNATELAVQAIAQTAIDAAAAANTSKVNAGTSETNAGNAATTAGNAATDAKRTVANNFPDRLDATGSWFTEATTGDPGTVAVPTAAAISNVAGYGYEYTKANAQGQLFTKGVLAAASGKFYEVEAEVEWTVKGGGETPSLAVGVQGLDAAFTNAAGALGQVQAPLQAVGATGVVTMKYRFGYAAPTGGAAWPSPGTSVWLRPYVLFNRLSNNSGPVTASTARVRRLTVRDVTAVVAAEIQAAAAAASAATVTQSTDAEAIAGTGVGLMNAPRVALAIAAQALPVGATLQAASNPGSRFLPCTGLNYLNATYPTLAPLMKPYYPPLAVRSAVGSGAGALAFGAGLFGAFAADNSYKTSPDGITWTARTNPFGANNPTSLHFGNGLFVAGPPSSGSYYTSPDAINWTARARPASTLFISAGAYANGRHVMVGMNSSAQGHALYSTDAVNWTVGSGLGGNQLVDVCYAVALARWGAVSNNGNFWYSDDNASSWTSVSMAGSPVSTGIAFGVGRFVATHGTGMQTSTNGASWTAVTDANVAGFDFRSVIFDGARFVAVGANGRVVTSDDGLAWTVMPSGQAVTLNKVARNGSALTSPLVVTAASGILSGLDQSTTQFNTPSIAADASNLAVYIKAS